ncbi:MAG: hypothetical protein K2W80_01845 [Burkholderiales bacterium]|nr:hypothetical protein [Burkholderiales bacterium]
MPAELPGRLSPLKEFQMRCHGQLFAAVALFQADDDPRDYLQGVFVEPHPLGGVYIAATDGSQLCVAVDSIGEADAPAIYRTDPALLQAAQASGMAVVAERGLLLVRHVDTEVDERIRLADPEIEDPGRFPEWRQVVRNLFAVRSQPLEPAGALNAHYLARIAKAAKLITPKKSIPSVQTMAVAAAHISYFGSRDDFFVVTMNMRGDQLRRPDDVLRWVVGAERGLFKTRPDDVDADGVVTPAEA